METMRFQSKIVESEQINPLFTRVKIHVAYEGLNRNNSFISKETFDNAAPTAKYCPIIGEWSESIEDFKDHGGKIEITNDDIKYINTTIPYGVIGDEDPVWETVQLSDGTTRDYFTVFGYIWTGRYPELQIFEEDDKSQSMEINIKSGEFQELGNKKVYVVNDMVFSGFCILGDDVEPCFEDSTIATYSLDKTEFKKQLGEMIEQFKLSLSDEFRNENLQTHKGGKNMGKENENFTLTSEQIENEIKRELSKYTVADNWGYEYQNYYFVDYLLDQNVVIAMDYEKRTLVGMPYDVEGDNVSVDMESAKRYKVEYVPMDVQPENYKLNLISNEIAEYQANVKAKETESKLEESHQEKVAEFKKKIEDLNGEVDKVKEEKTELEQFKANKLEEERQAAEQARIEAEEELFSNFSVELTEDEMQPIKEKASELSLEEIEEKLFSLAGRKKVKFNLTNKDNNRINMGVFTQTQEPKVEKDVWAEQKEKYNK